MRPEPFKTTRWVAGAILGTSITLAVVGLGVAVEDALDGRTPPTTQPEPIPVPVERGGVWDQRNFPCQEDEVLGYAPQFGPDRVGCIHIEEVK